MSSHSIRCSITASWFALALLTFLAAGDSSGRSWVLLAMAGIVPPAVMLALWKDEPPPTIAEVIHAVERKS